MHVASFEVSRELYEISQWEPEGAQVMWCKLWGKTWLIAAESDLYGKKEDCSPAYTLDFLLRKFLGKGGIQLRYGDGGCLACLDNAPFLSFYAQEPEDAVAKLAIELLKQGLLDKEREE